MKTPVGNIAPASKAEAAHIDTTSVQNQGGTIFLAFLHIDSTCLFF